MMNRGYSAEAYLSLVERARRIVPGIHLASDFIVGFPTETDQDYALTSNLVENVRYKNCFVFKYSPRPGTVAIRRFEDDVPEEVKKFRNNDLLRLQNRICNELNRELLGRTVEVLCEGPSGWAGDGEKSRSPDDDSVVAGYSKTPAAAACGSTATVELGSRLAAGMGRSGVDRHGNTYVKPVAPAVAPGNAWVQLTGRTTHDQIVVFQGPPSGDGAVDTLVGKLVQVRVRDARGMTIFGDLV